MINMDVLSVVLLSGIFISASWGALMATVIVALKVQAYFVARKMMARSLNSIPIEALLQSAGPGGRPGATTSKSPFPPSEAGTGCGQYI